MKTKLFFLLFLAIVQVKLSAQIPDPPDNKTGTGTVTGYHEYEDIGYPAFCGEELVDVLVAKIVVHYEVHFKNGNFVWALHQVKGEAISSSGSGEVFVIHDTPHKYDPNLEFQYETYNFKGNLGSHYVGTIAWNNTTWDFTIIRAICPGSKK